MEPVPASDLGRIGLIVGGRYRLDSVIGRGAMGAVWAATHVSLGHRVAIKLVARELVRSPEALRRFDAEAKAAARLQSRHVVQVFDNGTLDDGTPYIAMELLTGENLEQRIERGGPIALGPAVDVLVQCAKALGRAHAAGIVHRDIKPENVYLAREPDEDGDVVKILDFGVAKVTMAIEGWTSQTGTGAMLGTPIYMSPEQVRASRDVDGRSDLYSLGLVAFTMLTGKLAVDGETFGEVLLRICSQPLPSLRALAPGLPPAMEAWFQRACAREAADRYATAQDFVDGLRAAAGAPAAGNVRMTPQPPAPTLPMSVPPTLLSVEGADLPPVPFGRTTAPTVAQTASSVSVTSSGIPGVKSGVLTAALLAGGLVVVGGGALFVLLTRGSDPASPGAPPDTPSAESAARPAQPLVEVADAAREAAYAIETAAPKPGLTASAAVAVAPVPPRPVAVPVPVAPAPVPAPRAAAPPQAPAPAPSAKPKFNLGY